MVTWLPEKPRASNDEVQASLDVFDVYRGVLLDAAYDLGGDDCKRIVKEMVWEDGGTTEQAITHLLEKYIDVDVMSVIQAVYDRYNPPEQAPYQKIARRMGNSALAVIRHTRKLLQQTT